MYLAGVEGAYNVLDHRQGGVVLERALGLALGRDWRRLGHRKLRLPVPSTRGRLELHGNAQCRSPARGAPSGRRQEGQSLWNVGACLKA